MRAGALTQGCVAVVVAHEGAASEAHDYELLQDWVVHDFRVHMRRITRQPTRKVTARRTVRLRRSKRVSDHLVRGIVVEPRADSVQNMPRYDVLHDRDARA